MIMFRCCSSAGITFLVFALLWISCEKPTVKDDSPDETMQNTLETDLAGTSGHITEYFYGFDKNVDVEFYRYDFSKFDFSLDDYLLLLGDSPPSLNLRSFTEFLLEIRPEQNEYTERTPIDSLAVGNVIYEDSLQLFSTPFKHIESMFWDIDSDPDNQRYKPNNSDWIYSDVTINYNDTLDEFAYYAVVDTPMIDDGILFIDQQEFEDTTYVYLKSDPTVFAHTFEFERKVIGVDSLMFRINTDCNDNNIWDDAETVDTGNGIWDPTEAFYDINGNGIKDASEPFQDRNCNAIWDDAEELIFDANNDGYWDEGDEYIDEGNGFIDPAETFTDHDLDGQPDNDELYTMGNIPNRLLVDWSDIKNPQVLATIYVGDSLTDRWSNPFNNILAEMVFEDEQNTLVDNIDSLVTLYTNQVVAHVESGNNNQDYLIIKTEWQDPISMSKDYDYLLFKQDEHLYKLTRDSYFFPYGYYWSETQRESGFWFKTEFVDEILFYTPNGLLRDGERVDVEYLDTTNVAIYKIEKSYAVDLDNVTVPAKKIRGSIESDGSVICFADENWNAATLQDCPGVDTTFTDCFRITRDLTMTMIGTGVEYGERNITWLVKDYGVVKDEVHVRWSEFPGVEENWVGYSRWELGKYKEYGTGGTLMGRYLKPAQIVKLHEFNDVPEFDFDSYHTRRTAGLQRVNLIEN